MEIRGFDNKKKCATCNKVFYRLTFANYAYKKYINTVNGTKRFSYYCSYGCMRKAQKELQNGRI